MLRRFCFLVVLLFTVVSPVWAIFCTSCGQSLPDNAKFCSQCGKKVDQTPTIHTEPAAKVNPSPPRIKRRPPQKPSQTLSYRAKTDIFLYEKRGDARNVLKKNLFFKPRRYRLKRDRRFKILERVGDSCLVQSLPDRRGHTLQGWVHIDQLSLRSDWETP